MISKQSLWILVCGMENKIKVYLNSLENVMATSYHIWMAIQ